MRAETGYALLLTLVVVGMGFALYATYETYVPSARAACAVSAFFSCAKVDTSGHTSLLGIPDWSIGVAGFVVLLILGALAFRTWHRPYLQAFALVSALGLLLSLYLGYIELAIIQGLCPVCLGTYLFNAGALLTALYLLRQSRPAASETARKPSAPAASGGDAPPS